jgi:hypothetical protein
MEPFRERLEHKLVRNLRKSGGDQALRAFRELRKRGINWNTDFVTVSSALDYARSCPSEEEAFETLEILWERGTDFNDFVAIWIQLESGKFTNGESIHQSETGAV